MNNKYKKYLLSKEWAQLKVDLFDYRGRICEKCSSKYNLHVHHLTYKNIFNEEPEDLIILCDKCHKTAHGNKPKTINKRKAKVFKPKSLMAKLYLKKTDKKAYKEYIKKLKIYDANVVVYENVRANKE